MNILALKLAEPVEAPTQAEFRLARIFESLATGHIPVRPRTLFLAQAQTFLRNSIAVDLFFDTIEEINR